MSYDPAADAVLLTAALKAVAKKLGDARVEPGTHPVDCALTLRLTGALEKGPDGEYEARPPLPVALALALLCRRAKVSRADAKELIRQCALAALGHAGEEPDAQADRDRLRDAEEALESALGEYKVLKTRAGATRWLGVATVEKA